MIAGCSHFFFFFFFQLETILPIKTIKLYPTTKNFQRSDEASWPLTWAISYLKELLASLPEEERASAMIGPMGGPGGIEIWRDHTLSQEEVDKARLQLLLDAVNSRIQSGQGASLEDLKTILAQFHSLA